MRVDHRPTRTGGERQRGAVGRRDRQREGAVAHRRDDQVGIAQDRPRSCVVAARDAVARDARVGSPAVDAEHPQHQLARLQPEAGEAIDEPRHRTDVVRAEIGEPLRPRGLHRRIEGPERPAMQQRDATRAERQPRAFAGRLRLEQQRHRGQRAGRAADHRDLWRALAREQVGDPGDAAQRQYLVRLHQPVAGQLDQRRAGHLLRDQPVERLVAAGGDHHVARELVEVVPVRQPP